VSSNEDRPVTGAAGSASVGAPRLRTAILVSGRGSNMQALATRTDLGIEIVRVISNRPAAAGLEWAAARGLPTSAIDHCAFPDRAQFDTALARRIDDDGAQLVVLAGFMRVLTEQFVDRYRGRLVNIHPSLLPLFPGLHTHRRALEAGVKIHGCTVHYVTNVLDGGPILAQAAVPVVEGDDEDALAARVLAQEHRILPAVVRWIAAGRLHLGDDDRVISDVAGRPDAALRSPETG